MTPEEILIALDKIHVLFLLEDWHWVKECELLVLAVEPDWDTAKIILEAAAEYTERMVDVLGRSFMGRRMDLETKQFRMFDYADTSMAKINLAYVFEKYGDIAAKINYRILGAYEYPPGVDMRVEHHTYAGWVRMGLIRAPDYHEYASELARKQVFATLWARVVPPQENAP